MKIGIIGCGAIGCFIALKLGDDIAWAVDRDPESAKRLPSPIQRAFFQSVPKDCGGVDLVVEAASQDAVPLLVKCLRHSDVMIMSVGALVEAGLVKSLSNAAKKYGHKIYLPSGAIGGLDAVSAVSENASEVVLETIKPPVSFGRADREKTMVFDGSAREAVALYPKNVNVSATLAIAGIGFDKTRVRIVSDPNVKRNTHRITVKSDAGIMTFEFENLPFKENPKTSMLAAMAALERIKRIEKTIQVG